MRYLIRTVVGMFLLSAGLTSLAYGIAQAISVGSCGTDDQGRTVGPPCPSGVGAMIVFMVLGAFVGIAGGGLVASRGNPEGSSGGGLGMGIAIGQLRFWAAAIPAGAAAAAIGIIDFHEDQFQPGLEIVAATAGSIILVNVLASVFAHRSGVSRARLAVPPPGGSLSTVAMPPPGMPMQSPPFGQTPVGPVAVPPPAPSSPTPQSETGLAGLGNSTIADSGLAGAEQSAHGEIYAQLDRLAELQRSGALSQADYETARAKLLAGL